MAAVVVVAAAAAAAEAAVTDSALSTSEPDVGSEVGFQSLGVTAPVVSRLASDGIVTPTPIQRMAMPDVLAGRDVCGRAETGSGKTLAFGLPLLARFAGGGGDPEGLILVPTRELAAQVAEALTPIADVVGSKVVAVYGGVPMQPQIGAVKRGVDLLIATPGRLLDLERRNLVSLGSVKSVVIDEADQMADMGFLPQVRNIINRVPRGHQTLLFSATLDGQVGVLVRDYMHEPITHSVTESTDIADAQDHRFIGVHYMDKPKVAAAIINSARRSLVFCHTKRGADRTAKELAAEGIRLAKTHGDLRQAHREKSLDRFSDGQVQALIATNVAARGLHIDDVDVVIHYDPPDDFKTFVHRSGRTARAGAEGLVVTLVEWDQILDVEKLQRSVGLNTEIVKMYSNDPRLEDLASFEPVAKAFRKKTAADFSRRAGRRR